MRVATFKQANEGEEISKVDIIIKDANIVRKRVHTRGDASSLVNIIPHAGNVVIMGVYKITINDLLKPGVQLGNVDINDIAYYIVGVSNSNVMLPVGTRVLVMNPEYLAPIPENDANSVHEVKDYIKKNFPHLLIGATVANDKSYTKVGLNVAPDIVISQYTQDKLNEKLKDMVTPDTIKLGAMEDNAVVVVDYYLTPYSMISAIVDEE